MRQKRITKYAIILMGLIVVFLIFYPYSSLSWLLEISFLNPQKLLNSRWTGGQVTPQIRTIFFIMWLLPVIAGVYACLAGLYIANFLRIGQYFDERIAKGMFHLGFAIIISMVTDTLASSFSPVVLSWLNPDGQLGYRFRFDYADTGLVLCGVAFCIIGWVLREAILIAEENDGYI